MNFTAYDFPHVIPYSHYLEGEVMTSLSPAEIDLLEEFREELAQPWHVSNTPFITTLQAELITALYKVLDEKLAVVDGLPVAVKRSLKEVS